MSDSAIYLCLEFTTYLAVVSLMTSDMQPAPCNPFLSCCLKESSMLMEKRKTQNIS